MFPAAFATADDERFSSVDMAPTLPDQGKSDASIWTMRWLWSEVRAERSGTVSVSVSGRRR
jgi:hypothetical protein